MAPACTFLTVMLPDVVFTEMPLPAASVADVMLFSTRLPVDVTRVSPLATDVVRPPSRLLVLSRYKEPSPVTAADTGLYGAAILTAASFVPMPFLAVSVMAPVPEPVIAPPPSRMLPFCAFRVSVLSVP
ncbi:hypothetical protein D3C71_1216070 [compost metagenome]